MVVDGPAKLSQLLLVTEQAWSQVIRWLASNRDFGHLKLLLFGTDDESAAVTRFDASLSTHYLPGLVQSFPDTAVRQWAQKLLIIFLRNGAPYSSLVPFGHSALHLALSMGLKAGM